MKLQFVTTTVTFLPFVSGYIMMGASAGRPVVFRSACRVGGCSPQQGWGSDSRGYRSGRAYSDMNQETIRQQKEMMNRFFGLAKDITAELSARDKQQDTTSNQDDIRKQQEWVNRAFNMAQDVASGVSSPRYEVDDTETMFQVAIDVPGVPASSIEVNVIDEKDGQQVLAVQGERQIGRGEDARTAKFRKTFSLDSTVDPDKITAQLSNGVLYISAPKVPKQETVKKIPVVQSNDDDDDSKLTVDVAPSTQNDKDGDGSNEEKE